jgi:CDP-diacylglycerol--glycerol-3-phosphate 3-phosphatidyltransferase
MLNVLRPFFTRLLTPVSQWLARTPVTPNMVTVVGTLGVSASALALFPTGHLLAGVIVCTVFVFADMLDGTLARIKGSSGAWGAFLDSTMDRIADAAVFAGLAAYFVNGGNSRLMAGVATYCLVTGSLVSYAKARAQSLGVSCDVGIAERTERLLIALVAAGLCGLGVPYVLPAGLWILAGLTTITLGQRIWAVRQGTTAAAAKDEAAGAPSRDDGADRAGQGTGTGGNAAGQAKG